MATELSCTLAFGSFRLSFAARLSLCSPPSVRLCLCLLVSSFFSLLSASGVCWLSHETLCPSVDLISIVSFTL